MATISSSVRLSLEFESALRGLGTNRAALLLGFLLVGVAELGDASGLEVRTMQADLHQVLRYHLPEALRGRLEAVQATLRTGEPGKEAVLIAARARHGAPAHPAATARHDGVPMPERLDEPAAAVVARDPLAGEGDDY